MNNFVCALSSDYSVYCLLLHVLQINRGTLLAKCDFNLQSNFIEITLRYGCSPVNLPHNFKTPFSMNTKEQLLLYFRPLRSFVALIQKPETSQLICRVNQFTGYYMRATLELSGLSNDSRVSKSSEGLMSAFKVLTLHTGHCHSSSFFALKKNMLADNLNKICVHILTFLLAFLISVLLTSSNFTSGRISSDFMR